MSISPTPSAITGPTSVCAGSSITLSNPVSGGTWTSASTAIATIGLSSGVVNGITAGTAIITYSLGTGCIVTTTITVNPLPGPISGSTVLCLGSSTTLIDLTFGGTWSSGSTTVATIGASTGVVTGLSVGTSVITYTIGTGCITTRVVSVNAAPT